MPSRSAASPARRLRRSVTVAFVVKMLAVLVLYGLFFGPAHRPTVDPEHWLPDVAGGSQP